MTTTLQQIQDRAVAFSSANGLSSLVSDRSEIINRIAAFQRSLFDLATRENRYYFAIAIPVGSTGGASGRTINLSSLPTPCGRIIKFVLNDGRTVSQVDLQDLEAELSPRYYVLGTTMYEVSNDWSAVSGVVTGILTYVGLPTVPNVAGDLTQTVSLPDEFVDLLELKLSQYLAHKDVGRDPEEIERLGKMIEAREEDFISHITQFGGVEARRFNIPTKGDKK